MNSGPSGVGSQMVEMTEVVIEEDHWIPNPQQDNYMASIPSSRGMGTSYEEQPVPDLSPISYLAQLLQDAFQDCPDQQDFGFRYTKGPQGQFQSVEMPQHPREWTEQRDKSIQELAGLTPWIRLPRNIKQGPVQGPSLERPSSSYYCQMEFQRNLPLLLQEKRQVTPEQGEDY